MKFNRERFIDETSGDLGAAFDVVDALIAVLNRYIEDDEFANSIDEGCYGFPEMSVKEHLHNSAVYEYLDY